MFDNFARRTGVNPNNSPMPMDQGSSHSMQKPMPVDEMMPPDAVNPPIPANPPRRGGALAEGIGALLSFNNRPNQTNNRNNAMPQRRQR